MMPATLAILSITFTGRERATAFAAWGAIAGAAVAFGPVVGGFLTTNYSWRWAFGINVIIAPLAILGALLFTRPRRARARGGHASTSRRARWSSSGMFLLVFALSEGVDVRLVAADQDLPARRPRGLAASNAVSVIPLVMLVAARAPHHVRAASSGRRSGATRTRCSSSASCTTGASATA